MLAQDTLTGALYEVPEPLSGWGLGEYPYDGVGLGFPGLFSNIIKGVSNIFRGGIPGLPIPGLSSILGGGGGGVPGIPGLSNILGPLRSVLGGGGGGLPGLPGIPGLPNLGNLLGPLRGLFGGGGPSPGGLRPPLIGPGGCWTPACLAARWLRPAQPLSMRPPLPYTGVGPRRMYMRCSMWPAVPPAVATPLRPAGVVPVPGAPVPSPGMPVPGPWGGGGMHRRRRGGFRRRRR